MQQEIIKQYKLNDIATVVDLFNLAKNIEFTRGLGKGKGLGQGSGGGTGEATGQGSQSTRGRGRDRYRRGGYRRSEPTKSSGSGNQQAEQPVGAA